MLILGPTNLNPEPAVPSPRAQAQAPGRVRARRHAHSKSPAHRTDHRVSLPSVCIVARDCQSGIGVDTCIAAAALPLSWPHRQGSSLPKSHGLFCLVVLGSSHVSAPAPTHIQHSTAQHSTTTKTPCSHRDRDRGRVRHGPGRLLVLRPGLWSRVCICICP